MRDDVGTQVMVLLPDYPNRVVNEHRVRVEKIALLGLLLIITGGAWWLWPAVDGQDDLLSRSGHVFLLFTTAILLSDLIDFGPVERSRIAIASNLFWPSIIALAGADYASVDDKISSVLLTIIAISLWITTKSIFSHSLSTRRLRGMTSLASLALAFATLVAIDSNIYVWGLVLASVSYTMVPDLLSKDEMHQIRKEFSAKLEEAEFSMMKLRSENTGLEQPNSLLKSAREIGWKDPEKGLQIIEEAESEARRIIAISDDLEEIQADALSSVVMAEEISDIAKSPRKAFDMGLREAELGSLREAETLFRTAKLKAHNIIDNWQEACDCIRNAENKISEISGHSADSILSMLESAKEALESEDPISAIQIATNIPEHIKSLSELEVEATKSLEDAENAIKSLEGDVVSTYLEMMTDSRTAYGEGNYPLSKGISDSIIRDVRESLESSNEVTRALRQRKKLEGRFPQSGNWQDRLDLVARLHESSKWSDASSELKSLISDLTVFESELSDAKELLDFVNSEWNELAKRLDSKGIGIDYPDRATCLSSIAKAERSLSEGQVQECLKNLGVADSLMENLRMEI